MLAGCAVTVPTDPDGTLDRVRGGTLRVGVSANPPWTDLSGPDPDTPTGIEPNLVTGFADSVDSDLVWTTGGEESLIGDLEDGRLDMVIGGLTADSPWKDRAALTRSYVTVPAAGGDPEPHVMAVAMGENAFLVELELFLSAQDLSEVVS